MLPAFPHRKSQRIMQGRFCRSLLPRLQGHAPTFRAVHILRIKNTHAVGVDVMNSCPKWAIAARAFTSLAKLSVSHAYREPCGQILAHNAHGVFGS